MKELEALGVMPKKARQLVAEEAFDVIRRQLDWLPRRIVKKTAAGLLIACIEQDLPEPAERALTPVHDGPEGSFAKAFYAELTGAGETTLAEPTASDERRAKALIERISIDGAEAARGAGGSFGAFVRAKEKGKPNPVRMMSLAVTLYADEFLAQQSARSESQKRRSAEDSKKAHQERYTPAYEAFVASLAERLEGDDSLVERFEEHVSRKLAERRRISPRAAEILEGQLRDEIERGKLLVEFAQERGAIQVPSFWDWDKTRNDHAFGSDQ